MRRYDERPLPYEVPGAETRKREGLAGRTASMNEGHVRSAARPTRRAVLNLVFLAAGLVTPRQPPPGAEPSVAPNRAAPDQPALTLGLAGEARGLVGLDELTLSADLSYGLWRLRLGVAGEFPTAGGPVPRVAWSFSGPAGAAGAVEPSGLASFILCPQGLSYRLYPPSGRGRPLSPAPPLEAGWSGAAVGAEGGLFALEPNGLRTPALMGAWAAPPGSGLSALLAAAEAPARPGDGSWYAAPVPPRRMRWLAGAAAFGAGPYRGSLALGLESVSPGGDAYALRHESRLKLGPIAFELVAAFAGAAAPGEAGSPWLGPRLAAAPPAFAQASLRYARRFNEASIRYTGELAPVSAEPRDALDVGIGLGVPGLSLKARADYRAPRADAPERLGFAARLGLGRSAAGSPRAPLGVSAFGSWRAEGGRPLALELGAGLALSLGERRPVLNAEAAWRAAPEARSYRWRMELALPIGPSARLLAYGRSPGWRPYELPGGLPATGASPGLELGLRVSAALALY